MFGKPPTIGICIFFALEALWKLAGGGAKRNHRRDEENFLEP
jgi:hypothetical protein